MSRVRLTPPGPIYGRHSRWGGSWSYKPKWQSSILWAPTTSPRCSRWGTSPFKRGWTGSAPVRGPISSRGPTGWAHAYEACLCRFESCREGHFCPVRWDGLGVLSQGRRVQFLHGAPLSRRQWTAPVPPKDGLLGSNPSGEARCARSPMAGGGGFKTRTVSVRI